MPPILAVVVLVPACHDARGPEVSDTCSPCQTCGATSMGAPCGCIALYASESTCPYTVDGAVLACLCDAYCVDSGGVTCQGQMTCAGSNLSCPDGCHTEGAACGIG